MKNRLYTKIGRLADVLALIQVLALDDRTHRSEEGLNRELQLPPRSAKSWLDVAAQHPEFFRVAREKPCPLSLVARHVLPEDAQEERRILPADFTQALLETAIKLHDREVETSEKWRVWIPLLTALIGGALGVCSTLVTVWLTARLKIH
jgi:hypothetical protein